MIVLSWVWILYDPPDQEGIPLKNWLPNNLYLSRTDPTFTDKSKEREALTSRHTGVIISNDKYVSKCQLYAPSPEQITWLFINLQN